MFITCKSSPSSYYPQGTGIKSFLLRLLYEVVKRVGQDGLYWAGHCQVNSQWWRLPYWSWHFGFHVLWHCQVGLQSWQWWWWWWPYSLLIKKRLVMTCMMTFMQILMTLMTLPSQVCPTIPNARQAALDESLGCLQVSRFVHTTQAHTQAPPLTQTHVLHMHKGAYTLKHTHMYCIPTDIHKNICTY